MKSISYIISVTSFPIYQAQAYSPVLLSPLISITQSPQSFAKSPLQIHDRIPSPPKHLKPRDYFKHRWDLKSTSVASHDPDETIQNPSTKNIIQASFLIAGTAIGGGFLALPTVTAPAGFLPSATALSLAWFYLLSQSFILVECLMRTKEKSQADSSKSQSSPGISATAYSIFGSFGEQITRLLLVILIEATLISQISRAGTLLFPNKYFLGCIISSLSVAVLVFGPPEEKTTVWSSKANSFLLWIFLVSAGCVGVSGVNMIDPSGWKVLFLNENQHWMAASRTMPTFLKLLNYGEIIPIVCDLLNFHGQSIKKSIFFGSFLTLLILLGWSALGMALVPDITMSMTDPVEVLLRTGGSIKKPLFCLAVTAILTTMIGSYLALLSTAKDFFLLNRKEKEDAREKSLASNKRTFSGKIRLIASFLVTVPALSVASISPDLFLKAIDFAGNYPVLLLWGVIPSAVTLMQRWKSKDEVGESSRSRIGGPSVWIMFLLTLSVAAVGSSAIKDLFGIIGI